MMVKSAGQVISKAISLALGVNMGGKELLGLWLFENVDSKF
jgi:transposase-like protein